MGWLTQLSRRKSWWSQPGQFDWNTHFLRQRGLRRPTQILMAVVSGSASLIPLSVVVGPHSSLTCLPIGVCGLILTVGMSVFWLSRWPTSRQSAASVLLGLLCIFGWGLSQPNTTVAALAAIATAITGGYIAFQHSNKLLVLNSGVAIGMAAAVAQRLARESERGTAAVAFGLICFLYMSVIVAIRGLSRAMGTYATRADIDPLTGVLNSGQHSPMRGELKRIT